MGSLMAGWDSPVSSSQSVKFERNRSLTKDDINAYWSSRKKAEEEHLRSISSFSPRDQGKVEAKFERSTSLPGTTARGEILGAQQNAETSFQKLINKQGWWTSSSSAFLNEPPVMALDTNSKRYAYASQFHVSAVK